MLHVGAFQIVAFVPRDAVPEYIGTASRFTSPALGALTKRTPGEMLICPLAPQLMLGENTKQGRKR